MNGEKAKPRCDFWVCTAGGPEGLVTTQHFPAGVRQGFHAPTGSHRSTGAKRRVEIPDISDLCVRSKASSSSPWEILQKEQQVLAVDTKNGPKLGWGAQKNGTEDSNQA